MNTSKYYGMLSAVVVAGYVNAVSAQDAAPYATDANGVVPYWLALGPLPLAGAATAGATLDAPLVPNEKDLAPVAGDALEAAGTKLKWRYATITPNTEVLRASQAGLGNAPNVGALFVSYLTVLEDTPCTVYWGCSDSGALFLNGKEAGRFAGSRPVAPDIEAATGLTLKKGVNRLMIKVLGQGASWGVAARVVKPGDLPLKGLTIARAPDEREVSGRAWKTVSSGREALTGPLGTYLVAGEFGYLPSEEKMVVAASRGDRTWKRLELRDAATDKAVFRIPADGGAILPQGYRKDVNQYISRVTFGAFKQPGRYVLVDPETQVRSFPFDVADDVYSRAAMVLTRAFYYQRTGIDWDAKYAGKWARPAYNDISLARAGTLHAWGGGAWTSVGGPQIDATPVDVRGGWYDAGDPNKYTKNEVWAHNVLLAAYDINKAYLKDSTLNIPESGNGVPDLVDEARFTTEYLMRIQKADGSVYDRVSLGGRYDLETKKPTNPPVEIAEPCSGATLCAAAGLAYAAAIWQEGGWDKAFAKQCLDAALKSWKYMEDHPSPWPSKKIGSIDGGYGDEAQWRAMAAAALLRATGDAPYRPIVETWMRGVIAAAAKVDPLSKAAVELGYGSDKDLICHLYMTAKQPDAKLVAEWGMLMKAQAEACRDATKPGKDTYDYGAGLPVYHWGATAGIASRAGWMLWWADHFAPAAERPAYVQAAQEYVQFLFGRNPTRWTLVTSLQDYGATRSPQVMFHVSVLNLPPEEADLYLTPDAEHPNRKGVMPGFMLGGPARNVNDLPFDPYKPAFDFERMEPSIMYQCQGVFLGTYLAGRAAEYRK